MRILGDLCGALGEAKLSISAFQRQRAMGSIALK